MVGEGPGKEEAGIQRKRGRRCKGGESEGTRGRVERRMRVTANKYTRTRFILLSVQASATFFAIFTTSSLSLAMSLAVLIRSFLEPTSPASPL